jgi:hypothetical protein
MVNNPYDLYAYSASSMRFREFWGLTGGTPITNTPATPAPIDQGFYNSQIYKDFQNDPAVYCWVSYDYSPYFGQQTRTMVEDVIGLMSNT